MRFFHTGLLLAGAALAAGPPPDAGDAELLGRIRTQAVERLRNLPNYTCLETIQRFERGPEEVRIEKLDTVRIEVAYIDDKEWFAWPGETEFLDDDLLSMLPTGASGTGGFASRVNAVFVSESADFIAGGEALLGQRRTIRYDYTVPRSRSGFRLRTGSQSVLVGYHGSIWLDAETLDLIRVQTIADDIPDGFDIVEATDVIEFQKLHVGRAAYLLPRSEEMALVDATKTMRVNRTQFSNCRQFTGSSSITFDSGPADTPAAAAETVVPVFLPKGLALHLMLETPVSSEDSYVGQALRFRLMDDVKQRGKLIVPKGAVAMGRIVAFQAAYRPRSRTSLQVRFDTLEAGAHRVKFTARLEGLRLPGPGWNPNTTTMVWLPNSPTPKTYIWFAPNEQPPGTAVLTIGDARVRIPAGLQFTWRTDAEPPAK